MTAHWNSEGGRENVAAKENLHTKGDRNHSKIIMSILSENGLKFPH